MFLTVGAAIVVLGVLIFVHELGHFMAAKAVGIGVPRFSIGLGPPTPLSFKRGETEYAISWIPFGGYVKMATAEEFQGMDPLEGGPDAAASYPPDKLFETKPLWARVLVISAGVIMNGLFALLVHIGLLATYGEVVDPVTTVAVKSDLLPASATALNSVPFGSEIVRINGDTITSRQDINRKFLEPSTAGLHLEFAPPVPPVTLEIDGLAVEDRQTTLAALRAVREARIAAVESGSPAARAGFRAGDLVLSVDGDSVRAWHEMVDVVQANPEVPLTFSVLRGDSVHALTATPRREVAADPFDDEPREIGVLGLEVVSQREHVRVGLGGAIVGGVEATAEDSKLILFALRGLITLRIPVRELGGPVLIGQISGQTARLGLPAFLSFMALFSINLAILNLLPIPVLDGGQLVFLFAEGIRGKPLSVALRMRLTQFGLAILLGIMILALTNDLRRVFGL
jgi:regulator of sigma E protease